MSRIGVFLDRGSEQFVVKSRYLSTYQGLLELEASLPDYVLKPRVQAPRPKSTGKGGFVKRKERRKFELDEVAKQLEDEKKPKEPPKPLQFLHKIEKPIPRPPTPSVEEPNEVYQHLLTIHNNYFIYMINIIYNDIAEDSIRYYNIVWYGILYHSLL